MEEPLQDVGIKILNLGVGGKILQDQSIDHFGKGGETEGKDNA